MEERGIDVKGEKIKKVQMGWEWGCVVFNVRVWVIIKNMNLIVKQFGTK
jgi:hypothetical protein